MLIYKTKPLIIFLFALILLSYACTNTNDLKGLWYNNESYPTLYYITDSTCYDCIDNYRGELYLKQNGFKHYLSFDNEKGELSYQLKLKGDSLFIIDREDGTLLNALRRIDTNNYIKLLTEQKAPNIELPEAKGTAVKLHKEQVYINPFFVEYLDSNIQITFEDTVFLSYKDLSQYLITYYEQERSDDLLTPNTSLCIDSKLPFKEWHALTNCFRSSGSLRVNYILQGKKNDEVNIFRKMLRPLSKNEIDSLSQLFPKHNFPPAFPDHYLISNLTNYIKIGINKNAYKINQNTYKNYTSAKKQLRELYLKKGKAVFLFIENDQSTYQDYIKYLELVTNTVYELRNEYLLSTYNCKYDFFERNDYNKEAQKKYKLIDYGSYKQDFLKPEYEIIYTSK